MVRVIEVELHGIKVPTEEVDAITRIADVLNEKTVPYGRMGKKECVIYALQMIEEWKSRIMRIEEIK